MIPPRDDAGDREINPPPLPKAINRLTDRLPQSGKLNSLAVFFTSTASYQLYLGLYATHAGKHNCAKTVNVPAGIVSILV